MHPDFNLPSRGTPEYYLPEYHYLPEFHVTTGVLEGDSGVQAPLSSSGRKNYHLEMNFHEGGKPVWSGKVHACNESLSCVLTF